MKSEQSNKGKKEDFPNLYSEELRRDFTNLYLEEPDLVMEGAEDRDKYLKKLYGENYMDGLDLS